MNLFLIVNIYGNMEMKNFIKLKLHEALSDKPKRISAGVLIKCTSTNNVFLLLRNDEKPLWALVSGGIEPNENVLDGLKREIYEELFIDPSIVNFKFIGIEQIPEKNREFHYYEGFVEKEFTPRLDHENLNYMWTSKNHLPSPLYNGLLEKINKI